MNPQIREAAEEIVKRDNYVCVDVPPGEESKGMCWCPEGRNCYDTQLVDRIASHIALAERRGGERVVRAVENAYLSDDTIKYLPRAMGKATIKAMLSRQLDAARAALDEMGKE